MTSSHTDPDQGLTAAGGRIVAVDTDGRRDAIERLVTGGGRMGRGQADRFLAFAAANRISLDHLWARVDAGGRVLESVLAVPNPGRTALLFASQPAPRGSLAGLSAVIEHACRMLESDAVDLCQVLLEPGDRRLYDSFSGGGFSELAQLSYLERALPAAMPSPSSGLGCTLEPYDPSKRGELLEVLDASYEDTLDCPDLRGLRETHDILVGHEQTGEHDPDLWTLLRIDGIARGALLLNPAPASRTVELVYIGLAQSARGRGFGRALLQYGLRSINDRPERAVTLAVDERNEPALALYRSEGFRRVLRRVALIRSLRVSHGE